MHESFRSKEKNMRVRARDSAHKYKLNIFTQKLSLRKLGLQWECSKFSTQFPMKHESLSYFWFEIFGPSFEMV